MAHSVVGVRGDSPPTESQSVLVAHSLDVKLWISSLATVEPRTRCVRTTSRKRRRPLSASASPFSDNHHHSPPQRPPKPERPGKPSKLLPPTPSTAESDEVNQLLFWCHSPEPRCPVAAAVIVSEKEKPLVVLVVRTCCGFAGRLYQPGQL